MYSTHVIEKGTIPTLTKEEYSVGQDRISGDGGSSSEENPDIRAVFKGFKRWKKNQVFSP